MRPGTRVSKTLAGMAVLGLACSAAVTGAGAADTRATGTLWAQRPGCSLPSYKCPYSSRWAGVSLTMIRWHHRTRYFARMAVRFWYGGKWRSDVGWLRDGYWVFPLVYPYL